MTQHLITNKYFTSLLWAAPNVDAMTFVSIENQNIFITDWIEVYNHITYMGW